MQYTPGNLTMSIQNLLNFSKKRTEKIENESVKINGHLKLVLETTYSRMDQVKFVEDSLYKS